MQSFNIPTTPLNQDSNFTTALSMYIQSCNNLENVLFPHNHELLLNNIINKMEKFKIPVQGSENFFPVSLSSTFAPFQGDQLFPFEIEKILELLRAELEKLSSTPKN